jgi:hypothetical protein
MQIEAIMNIIYINQKKEIKNGENYCGAACATMLTCGDPQDVADKLGDSIDDEVIINYLQNHGLRTEKIVDGGSEKTKWGFYPSLTDFAVIMSELKKGRYILYHFWGKDGRSAGHYAIIKDYNEETKKFIFNDPAGDRTEGYFNDNGEDAGYDVSFLQKAGIKRLFSVWEA